MIIKPLDGIRTRGFDFAAAGSDLFYSRLDQFACNALALKTAVYDGMFDGKNSRRGFGEGDFRDDVAFFIC